MHSSVFIHTASMKFLLVLFAVGALAHDLPLANYQAFPQLPYNHLFLHPTFYSAPYVPKPSFRSYSPPAFFQNVAPPAYRFIAPHPQGRPIPNPVQVSRDEHMYNPDMYSQTPMDSGDSKFDEQMTEAEFRSIPLDMPFEPEFRSSPQEVPPQPQEPNNVHVVEARPPNVEVIRQVEHVPVVHQRLRTVYVGGSSENIDADDSNENPVNSPFFRSVYQPTQYTAGSFESEED